jgi:hypothetical protein
MVAAARRCCVCHRYKGMKLEVHHIDPKAKGGANTLENAIVLCFDCHADAGAYNPEHPRGTRITPQELRQAREAWYQIVRSGAIEAPKAEITPFHCRYIVGKSFPALREITARDLRQFPVPNSLLVGTAPLKFLDYVVNTHCIEYRQEEVHGNDFGTVDQYLSAYPGVEIRPTQQEGGFEYFTFERVPSREELVERVAPKDGVTHLLLQSELSERHIARALAYDNVCGGGFPEIYRTRPLWGVFLAITNVTDDYVTLINVEGGSLGYGPGDVVPLHSELNRTRAEIGLPRAAIAPKQTVVIPVAVVLGPLDHFAVQSGFSTSAQLGCAHAQSFSHVVASQERTWASFTWGPAYFPERIKFELDGFDQYQSVHALNVSNVYEIDRHWAMGSCPHAFMIGSEGSVRYLGEVLGRGSRRFVTDKLKIPSEAKAVVIAELEEETTFLSAVRSGSKTLLSEHVLHQGDFVVLEPVPSEITIEGYYVPNHSTSNQYPLRRNELVGNFGAVLVRLNNSATPAP